MLTKLEPFPEFQPTKPLSIKIEQFLRQYKVTDFACNSFQDTLLLKAGITEGIKPLGMEFIKPDFLRVGMVVESAGIAKINKFFKFFNQYDNTSTVENIENNVYSIRMDCTTCLEKVIPVFEEAFLQRIQADPACLEFYQKESEREHTKILNKKSEDKASLSMPTPVKDAFFSNTTNLKTAVSSAPINQPESINYFHPN